MTPRIRVRDIQADQPLTQALQLAKLTGFFALSSLWQEPRTTCFAWYISSMSFAVPRDQRDTTLVRQIMRPPVLLPSSIALEPLLENLRAWRSPTGRSS